MRRNLLLSGVFVCVLVTWSSAGGQQAETQPATAPAEITPITARVLELQGDVQHVALGEDQWQVCRVDDEYPAQTVIRTGVRSSIKLQIGDDDSFTAVVIESATKTIISEASRSADTKRVRIGVGYGRIRAGVVEGGLKSDFTVDCPVATLSKRGTWDFGLFYERGTDRFEIFLLDQGLVDAFDRVSRERRELLPREVVTQTMRRWLDEAQLRRNVAIVDVLGQSDIEVAFNRLQQDGLRVLDPQGGHAVLIDLSSSFAREDFAGRAERSLTPPPRSRQHADRFRRPEGYFGMGRLDELIPVILEANSPLVQKGLARPGRYMFRRSALETWLHQHGTK